MKALLCLFFLACEPPGPVLPDAGPDSGSWRQVQPLTVARFEAAAVSRAGKLYYLGGITDVCSDGSAACTVDAVDVYDPAGDSWTPATPLPADAPRHHLAVTVVGDTIYVLGGFVGIIGSAQPFTPEASTWSFDGSNWTRLADAPRARGAATAQTIGGKIYVAGGAIAEPSALDDLSVYDPSTNSWTQLPPMPTAREHLASCVVGGQLVAIGGWTDDKTVVDTVEAYDPINNRWTELSPLLSARGGLGAGLVDGVCYAVGGERWDGPAPGTFWDVQGLGSLDGVWSVFAPMLAARHGIGVAVVDRTLYVVGGGPSRGNSYSIDVEAFTPP
jgi:N-acetylneuraminic acid mutarotase